MIQENELEALYQTKLKTALVGMENKRKRVRDAHIWVIVSIIVGLLTALLGAMMMSNGNIIYYAFFALTLVCIGTLIFLVSDKSMKKPPIVNLIKKRSWQKLSNSLTQVGIMIMIGTLNLLHTTRVIFLEKDMIGTRGMIL